MLHALLIALPLAVQGGPAHADLHPSGADVYLEVGDVSTLWTAFEQAPLLQFLRDEKMKGLLESLGQPLDASPKQLVADALVRGMPDANPGAWLDGMKTVSLSLLATPHADGEPPFDVQLVIDFATPEQAGALKALFVAHAEKHEPMTAALPGVEKLVDGEEELWCAAVGPRVVLSSVTNKVEDYVARADKKSPGYGSNEKLKKALAGFEKPSGTPVLWFALSRSLLEILEASGEGAAGLTFLRQIPADMNPLSGARVARMQMSGSRFVTEMLSLDGGSGTTAARPIDAAWLEPVPGSAMFFYSTALDGAALGKKMRELLAKDEQSVATLAALEQKLGFGPERVLAHLGPGFTLYSGPLTGIGLPEMRVWVDCDDSAAFQADLESLVGALGETLPGFQLKTKPYKLKDVKTGEKLEVPVSTLTLPQGYIDNPMMSPSPSFSPAGKKLVFGLSSMDVKSELKRIYSGEGEPIASGANPLTARGFTLPQGAQSVVVMDWAKLFAGVLELVKMFAGMSPEALPFDLSKLPPSDLFAKHFKPTFHYAKSSAAGVYRRNEASFGPETWGGLFGAAYVLGMRQQEQIQSYEQMDEDEPAPEPTEIEGDK